MKIHLTTYKTIGQVQDEFSKAFPCLSLAFFSRPHRAFRSSPPEFCISDRKQTLGPLREVHRDGVLYIDPGMRTWEVEQLFERKFGLHVQVLRKSGDRWLITSTTDDLTLREQNRLALCLEAAASEPEDAIDFREEG
jgi:PAS domain-containing protein